MNIRTRFHALPVMGWGKYCATWTPNWSGYTPYISSSQQQMFVAFVVSWIKRSKLSKIGRGSDTMKFLNTAMGMQRCDLSWPDWLGHAYQQAQRMRNRVHEGGVWTLTWINGDIDPDLRVRVRVRVYERYILRTSIMLSICARMQYASPRFSLRDAGEWNLC